MFGDEGGWYKPSLEKPDECVHCSSKLLTFVLGAVILGLLVCFIGGYATLIIKVQGAIVFK